MSITDELRERAKTLTRWWYDPVKDEYTYTTGTMPPSIDAIRMDSNLTAIADRIDAEHEQQMRERKGCIHYDQERHYCNVHDLTTEDYKRGYDDGFASADDWLGQHESDMAEHGWVRLPKDADGEYIHVGARLDGYGKTIEVVELRYGRSGWVLISRDGNGYADTFAFTHHQPTVEDVLREFAYGLGVPVADSYVAATAAKLRLAEGEDA